MLKNSEEILKSIIIFTDGACSGNPGPGGWGAIIAFPQGQIKELGGQQDATTNNEMEMMALDKAFSYLVRVASDAKANSNSISQTNISNPFTNSNDLNSMQINVFSDSTYVIRGLTQWVWAWKNKNWKTAQGEDVKNKNLWIQLMQNMDSLKRLGKKISFHYSRGHVGTPGNERCDEIAVGMSQKKWVSLYEGDLINYSVSIYDLPEETELPPMKDYNNEKKKEAFCYLSYVDGKVEQHRTWAECEARVKGRSGAKFKKCLTQEDMHQLLKNWGVD